MGRIRPRRNRGGRELVSLCVRGSNEGLQQLTVLWGDTVLSCDHDFDGGGSAGVRLEVPNLWVVRASLPERPAMGKRRPRDFGYVRLFTAVALIHLFFIGTVWVTPPTEAAPLDELIRRRRPIVQAIFQKKEEPPRRRRQGRRKHRREEGAFGRRDRVQKRARPSKKEAPRVDPGKRARDRRVALSAGLLPVLSAAGDAAGTVLKPGGIGGGLNEAIGGLKGVSMGGAGGAGGLGTRGVGPGGGGRSLSIGGLVTHGGDGGPVSLAGGVKKETKILPGHTTVQGGLKRREISRVIRRSLPRFKFCYEKQLNANPNLGGKVSVYFAISPSGQVARASLRESTIADRRVEECVLDVMRSLRFPPPRGGGIVVVTYPFLFATP